MIRIARSFVLAWLFFASAQAVAALDASSVGTGSEDSSPPATTKSSHGTFHRNGLGQLTQIDHADGSTTLLDYDQYGRVSRIAFPSGPVQMVYVTGSASPLGAIVGGRFRTLPLRAREGGNQAKMIQDPDDAWRNAMDDQTSLLQSYLDCPYCFGVFEDVNALVGNLANYLQVGFGLGAITGAFIEALSGAAAEEIIAAAELAGIYGGAIAVSFYVGWHAGTALYDSYGNLVWVTFTR